MPLTIRQAKSRLSASIVSDRLTVSDTVAFTEEPYQLALLFNSNKFIGA
jgi:hypothetical protein